MGLTGSNADKEASHYHTSDPVQSDNNRAAPSDKATALDVSQSHHLSYNDNKTNSSEVEYAVFKKEPDAEKGDLASSSQDNDVPQAGSKGRMSRYLSKWKIIAQIFVWLLFTGYVQSCPYPGPPDALPLIKHFYFSDGGSQA